MTNPLLFYGNPPTPHTSRCFSRAACRAEADSPAAFSPLAPFSASRSLSTSRAMLTSVSWAVEDMWEKTGAFSGLGEPTTQSNRLQQDVYDSDLLYVYCENLQLKTDDWRYFFSWCLVISNLLDQTSPILRELMCHEHATPQHSLIPI